jgi:hypothetical protein
MGLVYLLNREETTLKSERDLMEAETNSQIIWNHEHKEVKQYATPTVGGCRYPDGCLEIKSGDRVLLLLAGDGFMLVHDPELVVVVDINLSNWI